MGTNASACASVRRSLRDGAEGVARVCLYARAPPHWQTQTGAADDGDRDDSAAVTLHAVVRSAAPRPHTGPFAGRGRRSVAGTVLYDWFVGEAATLVLLSVRNAPPLVLCGEEAGEQGGSECGNHHYVFTLQSWREFVQITKELAGCAMQRRTRLVRETSAERECPICMEAYGSVVEDGADVVRNKIVLPCAHAMCEPCYEGWKQGASNLETSQVVPPGRDGPESVAPTCPVCRDDISSQTIRDTWESVGWDQSELHTQQADLMTRARMLLNNALNEPPVPHTHLVPLSMFEPRTVPDIPLAGNVGPGEDEKTAPADVGSS